MAGYPKNIDPEELYDWRYHDLGVLERNQQTFDAIMAKDSKRMAATGLGILLCQMITFSAIIEKNDEIIRFGAADVAVSMAMGALYAISAWRAYDRASTISSDTQKIAERLDKQIPTKMRMFLPAEDEPKTE
jgi:hypothetical protein